MKDGISIVMAYHNRLLQLMRTLNSIENSSFDKSKLEVIIVDDNSNDENKLYNIPNLYKKLNFKIITLDMYSKSWTNACIPYNIGFNYVMYDKVIIQNPECYHMGDVLCDFYNNINDTNYISYGCYSIDYNTLISNSYDKINIVNERPLYACANGWYNHSEINPKFYHFCAGITTNNLYKLSGFDEEYKDGIGFDDNEILHRIDNLKLKKQIVNNPFVIHQWHDSVYHYTQNDNATEIEKKKFLFQKNQMLFQNTLLNKSDYKAKNNTYYKC